jgi:starvation-inducible outer membrane lipoprotein
MRVIGFAALIGLLALLLAGCGTSPETAVPEIEGPALVLFYTEG